MDDKIITSPNDTSEYKFAETEVASDGSAAAEGPATEESMIAPARDSRFFLNFKGMNMKRLIRPVLAVIAVFIIYFGYNFYASKKAQYLEQKKLMMQDDVALMQQQKPQLQQTITAPVVPVSPVPTINLEAVNDNSNKQMVQAQAAMQQKLDGALQELASGQEIIANLNESVATTEQQIAAMNQKIEQLNDATQEILEKIEKLKAPPKKVIKKPAPKPPLAYHVRAIVPGRVWIEGEDGRTTTLRVGDTLEGYGEVMAISPRQGMVVMSNGAVIQYGVDDF